MKEPSSNSELCAQTQSQHLGKVCSRSGFPSRLGSHMQPEAELALSQAALS